MTLRSRVSALLLAIVLSATPADAQTQVATVERIHFDQAAESLAEAQSFRYTAYFDGASTGVGLAAPCALVAAVIHCTADLPALTPGAHTLQISAARVLDDGTVAESPKTAPYAFVLVVAPAQPINVSIRK
jgi:hypothetical protein